MADTVKVLSAGSLRHAFPDIIAAFGRETGIAISLSLGPAGLLRERIEAGEPFNLFASANMAHPKRLASLGLTEEPVCFARNRLCALARADLGLTTVNFVDVLSDPSVKIGTSTPGDDPSGDYAFEMFEHIETRYPGIGEALKSRARQLVGGRHSATVKSTADLIADGDADLFLGYVSNARLLKSNPAFSIVDIPSEFSPNIEYGLALRDGAEEDTHQLRDFLLSEDGQEILRRNGFRPGGTLQTEPV